jgi:hypothetical protein
MFVYNRRFRHGDKPAGADRRRTTCVGLQSMSAVAALFFLSRALSKRVWPPSREVLKLELCFGTLARGLTLTGQADRVIFS